MNNLSEEQQRFLHRYVNNKGDFYKTIESMGLDLSHISSWREVNPMFEKSYQNAKQVVIHHIKEENYMMSLLKINDALRNGITQHTVVQKHRVGGSNEDGTTGSEFEVIRTTKHLGVPSWAINASLEENSLVKAIHALTSEGVLPSSVARKLLQSANKITEEIKSSFDISPDSDYINDKKAIALIKAAVLGEIEV